MELGAGFLQELLKLQRRPFEDVIRLSLAQQGVSVHEYGASIYGQWPLGAYRGAVYERSGLP